MVKRFNFAAALIVLISCIVIFQYNKLGIWQVYATKPVSQAIKIVPPAMPLLRAWETEKQIALFPPPAGVLSPWSRGKVPLGVLITGVGQACTDNEWVTATIGWKELGKQQAEDRLIQITSVGSSSYSLISLRKNIPGDILLVSRQHTPMMLFVNNFEGGQLIPASPYSIASKDGALSVKPYSGIISGEEIGMVYVHAKLCDNVVNWLTDANLVSTPTGVDKINKVSDLSYAVRRINTDLVVAGKEFNQEDNDQDSHWRFFWWTLHQGETTWTIIHREFETANLIAQLPPIFSNAVVSRPRVVDPIQLMPDGSCVFSITCSLAVGDESLEYRGIVAQPPVGPSHWLTWEVFHEVGNDIGAILPVFHHVWYMDEHGIIIESYLHTQWKDELSYALDPDSNTLVYTMNGVLWTLKGK